MPAAEPEHGRRVPERLREVRERRDADASTNQQRTRNVEIEAVAEGPEDVDRRSRSECTEGASSPAQGLHEKGQLTGRRQAEAHGTREQATGRLEHEELTRAPRVD